MKFLAPILALLLLGTPAMAQSRASVAVPHLLPCDPLHLVPGCNATAAPKAAATTASTGLTQAQAQQNPFLLLQQFTATDLQAALTDANAQTPPDTIAAACYTALLGLVNGGANPLSLPVGAFSTLQKARDLKAIIANLQSPNGPLSSLNVACAPLILDAQTTLIQLGLVGGMLIK